MKRFLYRGEEVFHLLRWPDDFVRPGGMGGGDREEDDDDPGAIAPPPIDEASNWFKIQVLDDETGNPVAGVPLMLKLPGREPEEFTTNSDGKVEVSDLPEGTVDILEMDDEEAYEVVSVA
jgi:hypothetical protein